ncbi:DUF3231 family protein [Pullulanibacillus sp. KACC 23026]|uniref:DUF3231 family protein n=1 Tax=Pullulanibacillus sp. KACC 23026 TaxID=3028315 RepID=UPI0023B03E51|nr:DUF3231 family protein [Pullulanibacillus sp. KACC 23026]WEG12104.1 DUF3231 family protein [Pullulanibacillus sp. KACC 23026]
MAAKNPLSASEIGTLWLTYQEKTLIMRILEYFQQKALEKGQDADRQAINIMGGLWQELNHYVEIIIEILVNDGVAIPVGLTSEDVNLNAPELYQNGFDLMFTRVLKEVSLGMYTINMNMAYREDVMSVYEGLTTVSQKIYKLCTHYLLKKGILTLPPKVTPPITTEFINNLSYLKGLNLFGELRPLNNIELGYLHHGIEANNIGLQLITGFAQVAEDKEVRQYFIKGKNLALKQIKLFEDLLLESDVQFSVTSGATVTNSTVAPFSQKLMMVCIFFLNGFSLVGQSFGSFFSLRNDISMKNALIAKEIYDYNEEGIKLLIKNRWLEEPPQMENRSNK